MSDPAINQCSRNEPVGSPDRSAIDLSSSAIGRRGFCNGLLLTSAGLAISAKAADRASREIDRRTTAFEPMRIEGAEGMMPGSSMVFSYPRFSDPAILVRTVDGKYHAYCQKCSHLGCSVYFERTLSRLECPCHQGSYDVKSGFVLTGPPQKPLDEIVLQLRGGQVWAVGRRSDNEPLIAD